MATFHLPHFEREEHPKLGAALQVFWASCAVIVLAFILLAALAAISAVSMRRKYLGLTARPADTAPDADAVGALPTDRSTRHVR